MSTTRSQFEEELENLRGSLLTMGNAVDEMLSKSIRALEERDFKLATDVISADDDVDAMDVDIESQCIRLIALQQPMARDLRLIGTALKINTDLERIGDHAVDIAKVARKLARDAFDQPLPDVSVMASNVREMLESALTAFVGHDLGLVQKVVEADDEVDTLFHLIRRDLHNAMRENPVVVVQASYMLFVAHYLERVADHAVNIAERVYFVETGHLAQLAKSHSSRS